MHSYGTPLPLRCQHLRSSGEVEGQLSEERIDGIFDELREPGPMRVMIKMADPEVLFDDVPDLRDGLVAFFLIGGQLCAPCGFSHNAVLDVVQAQEFPVAFSKVALVGKDLLDGIWGMTTAGDTEGEQGAVME